MKPQSKKTAVVLAATLFAATVLPVFGGTAEAGIKWGKVLGGVADALGSSGNRSGGSSNVSYIGANDTEFKSKQMMSQVDQMFFMAMEHHDFQTMQAMFDQGFKLDVMYNTTGEDVGGARTPLFSALLSGKRDMMQWILEHGANVTGFTRRGQHLSYLVHAVIRCDYDTVVYLHQWGAPINDISDEVEPPSGHIDPNGQNALNAAARWGKSPELFKYLIDNGIDIEHKNSEGRTPLLELTYENGSPKNLQCLLAAGANTRARDKNGKTALQVAMDKGNYAFTQILSQYPQ